MKIIRIGSGAGYGGDRIEPAIDLMERGNLDYIIFECLAERTIALAQLEKLSQPERGYNPLFEYRMEKILAALKKHPVRVITNMGAANPLSAARKARRMADQAGLSHLRIAAVTGDDVYPRLPEFWEQKEKVNTYCLLETISKHMTPDDVYVSGSSGSCQYAF